MKRLHYLAIAISLLMLTPFSAFSQGEKPSCKWLEKPVDDQTFKTFQDFFAYDRQLPFKMQSIGVKEAEGIRSEHLSFQSTPGEQVFANLYRSAGADFKKTPALIFIHGGVAEGKDAPHFINLVESYARAGFAVLAIDMKYFGERSTDLLTTYTEKEKHDQLYNNPPLFLDWVIQTVKDIRRSFDFLVDEVGIDSERIGLAGLSRGAVIGAVVGGVEHRLAAIALLYGGHFDALETGHLPAACPANYVGRISPRPLLFVNATQDTDFIRETSVLPFYSLAKSPKKIIWTEGGHAVFTDEARSQILQWLQENIK
jgi:poly(3-hydroxybutyrate) depolymerase